MTDPEPIRFLFDFISPYAYLAWTQIHALADRHGRQVLPVPILFAALLNTYGHKGPAEIPPKRAYVFKDTLRRAALFGVPLSPPPTHPFNPLLALRASSLPMPEDKRRDLISALFRATWAGGAGVESPESVAAAATSVGLDGESIVAEASTPEAKARVRAQTESALAQGAFGVPSIVIGQELFWGLDSFDLVDRHLRGEDLIDTAFVQRWATLEASASRVRG